MRCDQARERLSDLYDFALSPVEARDVRAHLDACADCRRTWSELTRATDALRRAGPADAPAEHVEGVLAAVDRERLAARPPVPRARRAGTHLAAAAAGALIALLAWRLAPGTEPAEPGPVVAAVSGEPARDAGGRARTETPEPEGERAPEPDASPPDPVAAPARAPESPGVTPLDRERALRTAERRSALVERAFAVTLAALRRPVRSGPEGVRPAAPIRPSPSGAAVEAQPVETAEPALAAAEPPPVAAPETAAGPEAVAGRETGADPVTVGERGLAERDRARRPRPAGAPAAREVSPVRLRREDGRLTLVTRGELDHVVPALIAHLEHPDGEVRGLVRLRLAEIRDQLAAVHPIGAAPDRLREETDDDRGPFGALFGPREPERPRSPAEAWSRWWSEASVAVADAAPGAY